MDKKPSLNIDESLLQIFESRDQIKDLVKRIDNDQELLQRAIDLSVSGNDRINWRATFFVSHVVRPYDTRIIGHLDRFIDGLADRPDGIQRDVLRILSKVGRLNDEQEVRLFDVCSEIWKSIGKIPSTRIHALKFLMGIRDKYPDLENELQYLTEDQYLDTLSPGIKKGALKLIKSSR